MKIISYILLIVINGIFIKAAFSQGDLLSKVYLYSLPILIPFAIFLIEMGINSQTKPLIE